MNDFLEIKRVYECDGVLSTNLLDVLPRKLTIDKSYIATMHQTSHNTAFREVNIFRQTPYTYLDLSLDNKQLPKDVLLRALLMEIGSCIKHYWRSNKLKIVYHSSGYDSRLLSSLIRQLYIENGKDWLGNVIFVCTKWEGDEFKAIMEHQGWEPHQWVVVGERDDPEEYYASSLDFSTAWQHLNGACGVPTNIFWHTVQSLIMMPASIMHHPHVTDILVRHIPILDNTQCWSGYFGNELLSPPTEDDKRIFYNRWKKLYLSTMAQRPLIAGTIFPYAYLPALKVLYSSPNDFDIRKGILRLLDPAVLEFPRIDHHGDRGHEISDRLYKQVINDYKNSWYGDALGGNVPKRPLTTDFRGFWSRWSLASLCEHLLELGHELELR